MWSSATDFNFFRSSQRSINEILKLPVKYGFLTFPYLTGRYWGLKASDEGIRFKLQNGIVDIFAYSVWTTTFLELTAQKEVSAREVFVDDLGEKPHDYHGHKNLDN